ncbi:hypothetical protein HPULCUR_001236 [Helicostylum pulchrum]|uniref:Gag1-like clamp domain-containing protein n=1 Tax=Helicostylum pulchrum TaxID=562976 RepID=A0ABP9XM96_9FUNG
MTTPTIGLEAWEANRKEWTTPNEQYKNDSDSLKEKAERCGVLLKNQAERITFYQRLVLQRQSFRTPVPLQHVIPILVTGWQEDGLWPKGMVAPPDSD